MDMLSVLLDMEKPTILLLDHALLVIVGEACSSIGPNITAAFEGEKRRVFQALCLHIAQQRIQDPLAPDAPRFNRTAMVAVSVLGAGCMFGVVSPRLLHRRICCEVRRIERVIRRALRRCRHRNVQPARLPASPLARSATKNPGGTLNSTNPAGLPVTPKELWGKRVSTESGQKEKASIQPEGGASREPERAESARSEQVAISESEEGGNTAKDLNNDPVLTTKRKASAEHDLNDEGSLHSSPEPPSYLQKSDPRCVTTKPSKSSAAKPSTTRPITPSATESFATKPIEPSATESSATKPIKPSATKSSATEPTKRSATRQSAVEPAATKRKASSEKDEEAELAAIRPRKLKGQSALTKTVAKRTREVQALCYSAGVSYLSLRTLCVGGRQRT